MTAAGLQFLAIFSLEIAALHLFFRWIEKRLPPRPEVDLSHLPAETRKRIAKRANRWSTLVAMVAMPVLCGVWAYGFYRLQWGIVPAIPGTRFVRLPGGEMHIIIGIFPAIVLSGPFAMGLMKLVYRGRFHEVMAAGDAHFQFDVRRWMYATFVWIVPLGVDAESLWIGRYAIFTEDGIHSRAILERRGTFHPYAEVAALYGVDGRKLVNRDWRPDRRFLIVFRDRNRVPTPRFAYEGDQPDDLEPLKFVQKKTGLPIQWVQDFP